MWSLGLLTALSGPAGEGRPVRAVGVVIVGYTVLMQVSLGGFFGGVFVVLPLWL